jgi:integrase
MRVAPPPDFSKRGLEKLHGQQGQRAVIHDPRTPGLRAELREGGSIAFYVFKRVAGGGPVRKKLGDFPVVSIDQARRAALDVLSDLSQGINVAVEYRRERGEPTVADLFAHWLDAHAKLHKKTWQEDQRQYDKFLARWKNRRLSEVRRSDVQSLHARIGRDNGHYAANRVLALVRAMFNRAVDLGHTGPNPTKGIKKFREQSRDRFLQPTELAAFFAACDAEPNETLKDFFRVLLYTGARRSNVQAMAWAELDLAAGIWRIPVTKSGEPVRVHLPAEAVAILKRRKADADGCQWVFPGGKKNRAGHLQSPKTAWARLVKRAGLDGVRMHDLRRTLGSFQAAAGASMAIIGASLGHEPGSPATAVYARLNLDPVKASVDVAVAAMLAAAAKGGSDGK